MDQRGVKRKRVSKNKKKSWKKHVDVTDVEEYLEEKRLQERTGGLVAEKTNEELFFVDKGLEDLVPNKKKSRNPKPLRCYKNLQPDSKIKPARVKHNIITADEKKKKSDQVLKKVENGLSKKQAKSFAERKSARLQKKQQVVESKKLPVVSYDLWGDEKKVKEDEHYLRATKKINVKAPKKHLEKPSGVPSVEVAPPGASYNPTFEDHQKLLHTAHLVEVKKNKEEQRIYRSLDAKFPEIGKAPSQETWMSEMSAGLFDEADGEASIKPEELDSISCNPPVRREDKKTLQQRRKEKERKEKEKERLSNKEQRIMKNELNRYRSIKKQVKERESELTERQKRKADLKEKYKDKPKKLGRLKFEAPDIEIKLSDELEGSLRLLKPEGHLLEDRFKSLQKRNVIESRTRAKHEKKYKRKKFEKKSHKAVTL